MKILVTGAAGFIGKNLIAHLRCRGYHNILSCDVGTPAEVLDEYAAECGFVFHLAGVNRPDHPEDFMKGNAGATTGLLDCLKKHGNKATVLLASSAQAELDNPYGRSKKAAEELLSVYAGETGADVMIYRMPGVFGKWCRPDYNSVVATFCHNIVRGLPIHIDDPEKILELVYIDDVAAGFIRAMEGQPVRRGDICCIEPVHTVRLRYIAELLQSFRDSRENLALPDMSDPFVKKLYSTYLSYLPEDGFAYDLNPHMDARGFFAEFVRTPDRGQFSVSVSRPGVLRGNHWHHTKNEKFLAVSGEGVVRLRKLDNDNIIEYRVSGEIPQVVDIPPGYVHSILNTGDMDMVVLMWANECFEPENPDTYPMEVDLP